MEEKEFLEKTDKANEELIKSNNLSQETKSLGNKLLLISVISLLWSSKLIKFGNNTIEFSGINVTFEQDTILNFILFAVVLYFFVQFFLEVLTERDGRKNVSEMITEIRVIGNTLISKPNECHKKINELWIKKWEEKVRRVRMNNFMRFYWQILIPCVSAFTALMAILFPPG